MTESDLWSRAALLLGGWGAVGVIGILASMAVPNLIGSKATANERAVLATLRTIATAQTQVMGARAVDIDRARVLFATEGKDARTVAAFAEDLSALPVRSRLDAAPVERAPRAWSLTLAARAGTVRPLDTLFVTANLNAGGAQRSLAPRPHQRALVPPRGRPQRRHRGQRLDPVSVGAGLHRVPEPL